MKQSLVQSGTFWGVLLFAWSLGSLRAAYPPIRSSYYDGSAQAYVEFDHEDRFDSEISMTIEAWVYRENAGRIETILSHGSVNSYWFGFNDAHPSFTRSGSAYVESPSEVPAHQWTHLAVTYDGTRARFYHNGILAGSSLLENNGTHRENSLRVGADILGANLLGSLDEVRLWSVSRTAPQIERNMFSEVRNEEGLVAAISTGSDRDHVLDVRGTTGSRVIVQVLGILPANLVIPKATVQINVDGRPQLDSEYACAEQVVIRYQDGANARDAHAYLVYSDDDLHVAVTELRDVPLGRDRADSWVGISFDPDRSRAALAEFTDVQFRGFLNGRVAELWVGDGRGGLFPTDLRPGDTWQVAYDQCPDEFAPPCMEFQISKGWLGEWTGTNGFMIGHFSVRNGADHFRSPGAANETSPATWVELNYGETTCVLPVARLSGFVFNNAATNPIPNHAIQLVDDENGTLLDRQFTDATGRFEFDLGVPVNHALRLVIEECTNCRYLDPRVANAGVQPDSESQRQVIFRGFARGTNRYARVDFYVRLPIDAIGLTGLSTNRAAPRLRLREVELKELTAETIQIEGVNLHPEIQVFLSQCLLRPIATCVGRDDHLQARVVDVASDGTSIEVELPEVPPDQWAGHWTWWVRDLWERPGRVEWQPIGGTQDEPFFLKHHEYPLIHGFEFDNRPFRAWWQEFDGVYGANGWTPLCIRDPFYLLWFPIFKSILDATDGACNGMASTSLLFARGTLDPSDGDFDTEESEGVLYAAGLLKPAAEWHEPACAPDRPANLYARIRSNHGVQLSEEFIRIILDQIQEGVIEGRGSITGDPVGVLDRVRENPDRYVVSMAPELGRGHVVTPYNVEDGMDREGVDEEDSLIWIYDNNHPQRETSFQRRFIEIMRRDGVRPQYYLPRNNDVTDEEDGWRGDAIFSIPISVFRVPHTAPGPDTLVDIILTVIAGAADGLYSSPDGEWGWRADGTVVDRLKGAKAVIPMGGPNSSTRQVMLFLPATNPPPSLQINVRGEHYYLHVAHAGCLLQLEQFAGVAGDRDQASLGYDGGRLASLRYVPQRRADRFHARIGIILAEGEKAVFEFSNLALAAGQPVQFKALPEQRGVELRNDSTEWVAPKCLVEWIDIPSFDYGATLVGPIEIPAGASLKLLLSEWPDAARLRSELDLNRDGVADVIAEVEGTPVGPIRNPLNPTQSSARITPLLARSRTGAVSVTGVISPTQRGLVQAGNFSMLGDILTPRSEIRAEVAPQLVARLQSQTRNFTLSWSGGDDLILEETTDLGNPDSWNPVPLSVTESGGERTLSLRLDRQARFFRLRQR